jgi:uncharacterized protein
MSRFREVFTSRHVLLAVIHVTDLAGAVRNARVARDAGMDGAFLISHGAVTDDALIGIAEKVRRATSGFWIGVNCLSTHPLGLFAKIGDRVPGVWADDALITESSDDQVDARQVRALQEAHGWRGLYFGGVAFKYQRAVRDLARVARLATAYMDVVTTSGPGSGEAADPAKVRTMKQAIGPFPLALASGVTPENAHDYLPHADCFLTATGISQTSEELDADRARDLVRVVRSWPG